MLISQHSIYLLTLFLQDGIVCPTLLDPTNGHITFLVDPSTSVLTATYACDPGYGLSIGDMVRTCLGSEWNGVEPVCEGMASLLACALSCVYIMCS